MNITDLLAPDRVFILDREMDKVSLLRSLAGCAADILKVDRAKLTDDLLNREELGSTGIGSGIAIPHARLPEISQPLGVLALLRQPIDFDAVDDEPVDVVFMLVMPTSQSALTAITGIARLLRQQDIVNSLRQADDEADICKILASSG